MRIVNRAKLFTVTIVPSEPAKRPTLKDVAAAAGVSHMTASRVVRGVKNVSRETARRVNAAIESLGYRPDPTMSALASYRAQGQSKGDGSVLVFLDCDGTEFSQQVLAGVEEEARRHGYLVERKFMPESNVKQRQLDRQLFHRGVRGLLLGPSDAERSFLGWSMENYAAVSLGALCHRPLMHAVASDYFYATYSAVQSLLASGAQRIGFAVDAELEARTGHRWLGGYTAALLGRKAYVYQGTCREPKMFREWARRQQLDGIVSNHQQYIAQWRGAAQRFYLLNDYGEADSPQPRLVSNPQVIGMEGARLLHHLLLRRDYGTPETPQMVSLRGEWHMPSVA
ncbi:LacI family DNA-binding transcriptional regulator [Cerasicoccus maritimus]|uniref:LacI family DNA-binding transcriptional regulator n=1 Tax=Cerasicoccus maritimus TaxID=490089 RepID=UPI0028527CEB|nr:LacI family DNA-binding transcriptional regulator [Cerasicoccus maritimus]